MEATKATSTLALLGVLLVAGFRTFVEMVLNDKSTVVVIELLFPFQPRVRRSFFPVRKNKISCPTASNEMFMSFAKQAKTKILYFE